VRGAVGGREIEERLWRRKEDRKNGLNNSNHN
jgi:hypothetical protein